MRVRPRPQPHASARRARGRSRTGLGALILAATLFRGVGAVAPPTGVPPEFAVPPAFAERVRDRATIDRYQTLHHRAEPGINPTPLPSTNGNSARRRSTRTVRIVESTSTPDRQAHRFAHQENAIPPRGYRAPILGRAGIAEPISRAELQLDAAETAAAETMDRELAREGLLPTLATVLARLGPAVAATNGEAGLARLARIGFPADLVAHFRVPGGGEGRDPAEAGVRAVARQLADGAPLERVREGLRQAAFEYRVAEPAFRIATEGGEAEVGRLRMQAGGGWKGGLVPGEPLEVIPRLMAVFPAADFVVHVPRAVAEPVEWLAANLWPLQRRSQLILCVEPFPVSPWAQDNAKPGLLESTNGGPARLATLVPRYAAMGEGPSMLVPGDSYLADTLASSGHPVIASQLLFQGGNLLAARHPATGERLLFVNESSIHANVALGLSGDQVREAFRREFGVDRCVVLPAVSYHLDFDLGVRAVGTNLVAFVNEPGPVVRGVVDLGLQSLVRHGSLDAEGGRSARADLAAGRASAVLSRLENNFRTPSGGDPYPAALSKHFVADSTDDAEGNLQVFLLALDLLRVEAAGPDGVLPDRPGQPGFREYLEALRRAGRARESLTAALRREGLRVEPIPSLPDLHRSINYLNGLHHPGGFVMPGFGGFYAPLDRAARDAYQAVLGPDRRVDVIPCAGCQRKFGGLHCLASAYPAVPPAVAPAVPGPR